MFAGQETTGKAVRKLSSVYSLNLTKIPADLHTVGVGKAPRLSGKTPGGNQ